jgi:hypothetical protein
MGDITNTTLTKVNTMQTKNSKISSRIILSMMNKISNELVAYDNDSWSDEFRQCVRDVIKAIDNLRKFF